MSKLTLTILLIVFATLIIMPLWSSWKGTGESTVTKEYTSDGSIRYYGSRSWGGGGPATGK